MGDPMPRREWLAVVFPPACFAALLADSAHTASSTNGWLAFSAAFVAGLLPTLGYTVYLARHERLFLRDPEAIEENRARGWTSPLGWSLAAILLAGTVLPGFVKLVAYGVGGGFLLGIWPGLVVNVLRLRREQWWTR